MTPTGTEQRLLDFIIGNTERIAPPLVPELRLHLATEATSLWYATEVELEQQRLPPPFWAFAWAGGQAVARYVIDHPQLVAGKRVLDFGAGSGIAGIAALWVSAATVVANDIDPAAATAVALNAETNGLSAGLQVVQRDMLAEPVLAEDGNALFDTVLAGDVFYERAMTDRALSWLKRHATAGATVLFGDPGRQFAPKSDTVLCAEYDVPVPRDLEDRDLRETAVWRIIG